MTVPLPNVRKLFVPDPGYMMFDADLSGADAQVVAAEAEDKDLLAAFRAGLDVHSKNAADMWGDAFTSLSGVPRYKQRQRLKSGVHGTNYGASARALFLILGGSIYEWQQFQNRWFTLHPGIREWQQRTMSDLRKDRTARNRFGYRIIYFDRVDGLLPQALAWIPQSTIAINCFRGALALERACPWAEILLQVHDSVVFQVPFRHAERYADMRKGLRNPIPYTPELIIDWKLSRSEKSWGECTEVAA